MACYRQLFITKPSRTELDSEKNCSITSEQLQITNVSRHTLLNKLLTHVDLILIYTTAKDINIKGRQRSTVPAKQIISIFRNGSGGVHNTSASEMSRKSCRYSLAFKILLSKRVFWKYFLFHHLYILNFRSFDF